LSIRFRADIFLGPAPAHRPGAATGTSIGKVRVNFIVKLIGTFAFTGYFPVFPATFASLVFVLVYALVPGGEALAHPVVVVVTLAVSIPVATRMEKLYGTDPGCIVIDEVVGMQAVLVGAAGVSGWGLALAFVLFRVFDIAKPSPISRSQKLPGGVGVVVDDLLAAVYTRVLMIVISLIVPSVGRFAPWSA
jgi:phosphatidylglycerophosphatase A